MTRRTGSYGNIRTSDDRSGFELNVRFIFFNNSVFFLIHINLIICNIFVRLNKTKNSNLKLLQELARRIKQATL